MRKITFRMIQIAFGIYLVCYLTSSIRLSDFWGNILSPVGAFAAAGICFYAGRNPGCSRGIGILLGLACFSWALADTLWAVCFFALRIDPEQTAFFLYAYLPSNILIAAAYGLRLFRRHRKWNTLQYIADISAVTGTGMLLIWMILFQKGPSSLPAFSTASLPGFLNLFFDVFILAFLLACATAFPEKKPASSWVLIFSTLLYVAADAYFWYRYDNGSYLPNSLLDFLYLLSLAAMACGVLMEVESPAGIASWEPKPEQDTQNMQRFRYKGVFLLVAPVLLIAINRYDTEELLLLLVIAIGYELVSGLIQKENRREALLANEKNRNEQLEDRILERTRELERANGSLDYLSRRDVTTNLYNRHYFMNELEKMLRSSGEQSKVALFVLDLDRFKAINDAYGHEVGDRVLIEISRRLNVWNRDRGILARLGGDEFVLAFRGDFGLREAAETARQITGCCRESVPAGPYQLKAQMSIGVTLFPTDAKTAFALLKNAEIAMYHAKRQNGNRYAFFNAGMNERVKRETDLEMLLKKADYESEFELFYQPQFHISGKKLVGAEALVRWNSPEKGRVMPVDFIPLAEETGVIIPLGAWILKAAALQAKDWNTRYGLDLRIGVNVSARQFYSPSFLSTLQRTLQENQVEPQWLDIEVTESIAMNEGNGAEQILEKISRMGMSISIDDFGTGYSSFSSLRQFRLDRLKIAKPMVDGITTDARDANIVRAIAMMAKALHLSTIAEGVEDTEQLRMLADMGCDEIQGYLWGRPVPAEEFELLYLQYGRSGRLSAEGPEIIQEIS